MRRFVAGENERDMRLSRFVQRVTLGLAGGAMHKHFRNRRVKVNGRRAAPEHRLQPGDVVELYLNDEYFPAEAGAFLPQPAGPLPEYGIAYEDGDIAVLYKPAGVLSHRDAGAEATLLDAYLDTLVRRGEYRPEAENQFAPALAGRLDRGTEGLLLAAKTAAALRDANEVVRLGLLEKTYLCVCAGTPPEGLHRAYLARDRAARTVRVTAGEAPGAKAIATGVKVVERCAGLCLCQVVLHTGRTHQIRAHLAFLGAPLAGDTKYGNAGVNQSLGLKRQALCAWRLAFAQTGIPPENSLARLAGHAFTAEEAALPGWWAAYKKHNHD